MRRLLIITLAWGAVACGGATSSQPEPSRAAPEPAPPERTSKLKGVSRDLTDRERAVLEPLLAAAEDVRGLSFDRPVTVLVQDREVITRFVEDQLEDDDLARARVLYAALGLLDPELDVRAMLLRLMGEQVLGYYDPDAQRLAVRNDVMTKMSELPADSPMLDEARIVLVHELVHALQDQHFGLSESMNDESRDTDEEQAFHALVEGDAMLAMYGYLLESQGQPLEAMTSNPTALAGLQAATRSAPMMGDELSQAPAIVRVPLLSAYIDGLGFAAYLHGRHGWAGVDDAHRDPPVSGEQVLHPEAYERGELPDAVTLPPLTALEEAGYRRTDEDTLGELEMRVYFGQAGDEAAATQAAEGWSGDRVTVLEADDRPAAIVWLSAWDTPEDAWEAEQAAQHVQQDTPADTRGRHLTARKGRAVLIVRHLDTSLHPGVLDAFRAWAGSLPQQPPTRASTGDAPSRCALAGPAQQSAFLDALSLAH